MKVSEMRYRLSLVSSVIMLASVHLKKCEHTSTFPNASCFWFWHIMHRHVIRSGSKFNPNPNLTGQRNSKIWLNWFGRGLDWCSMLLTWCWINHSTWNVPLKIWPWGFENGDLCQCTFNLFFHMLEWHWLFTLLMRLTFSYAEKVCTA